MEASNPTSPPKKVEEQPKNNLISDEYGFPISNEPRLLESYQKFEGKHKRRTERLLSGVWKDVRPSLRKKIILIEEILNFFQFYITNKKCENSLPQESLKTTESWFSYSYNTILTLY